MGKWSDDGLIFYDESNEGWATGKDGQTVCICQKSDVEKILTGEKSLDTLTNPKQREALEIIINIREAQDYGKRFNDTTRKSPDNKRPALTKRTRPLPRFEHNKADIRRVAPSKRVSNY